MSFISKYVLNLRYTLLIVIIVVLRLSIKTIFMPYPVLLSNGHSVEGADHQFVVQCIRQSGKQVKLVIVTVSEEEARRLEPENSSTSNALEYYERRSVPVSVSSTEKKTDDAGKEYVVSILVCVCVCVCCGVLWGWTCVCAGGWGQTHVFIYMYVFYN